MILCDVGNTSFHFYDEGKVYKESVESFKPNTVLEDVFFICVNPRFIELLNGLHNWKNLADFIDMSQYYETMGIDRIVACEAMRDGVIVDAGSAITVDIVKNGSFEGGFIYPGVKAMQKTYANISSHLDYSFNFELDLDKMPKNSRDSISYGFIKIFYSEVISHEMEIILTGGDAKKFAKIFPSARVDDNLIFNGMKKIMKKANIC